MRLLPMLAGLYTLCLIDRTNIGGARISGLDEAVDLDIGNRASVISGSLIKQKENTRGSYKML